MQQCTGYRSVLALGSPWSALLLPIWAAVIGIVGNAAPLLAARLLAPCGLQEAQYVYLKVLLTGSVSSAGDVE